MAAQECESKHTILAIKLLHMTGDNRQAVFSKLYTWISDIDHVMVF